MAPDHAERAREAIGRHRWSDAVGLFEHAEAVGEQLAGRDLLDWGMACYWLRDLDGAVGRLEAAAIRCREQRSAEVEAQALQAAIQIASWSGRTAVMTTGATRLRQLLDSIPEGEAHAIWQWAVARMVMESDFEGGARLLEESLATALRVQSSSAEALALMALSQVDTVQCRVEEALRKVDAAAALALSGEVRPLVAGGVLCGIIWSCRNVGDWDRASEWTDVASRWAERTGVSMYPGLCSFHRCEILRVKGDLEHAESHALRACEELAALAPVGYVGIGYRELGLIRLLRGDADGARKAFQLAVEHGVDPNPGLALLRMREGEQASARRGLEEAFDAPLAEYEIPFLLPVLVTVCIAEGDLGSAELALERLDEIATSLGMESHQAAAAQGRAELALARGDLDLARRSARSAAQRWNSVGAPYESARARETLALIGLSADAVADAVFDLETARSSYERIGASYDAARITERLRRLDEGPVGNQGETPSQVRAFMFTDIVDSTRLQAMLGDDRWLTLLAWHDRTLRDAFAEHGGEVVKHEGDGFFVSFADGRSALRAGCLVQQRLETHREDAGFAPELRIGVHEGMAVPRADDWFGMAVTMTARVAASGGPGEVVCTDAILASVPAAQVAETRVIEAKGVDQPVTVHLIESCR